MGFLTDVGNFAGGAVEGVGTGFGLRTARDKKTRDNEYRLALKAGLGTNKGNPNYESAADIAAAHGRFPDAGALTGMADRKSKKSNMDRAQTAMTARDLFKRGDIDGLNRFVKKLPPEMFGLESHRKPDGIFIKEGPDGKKIIGLQIDNGKTGTRGPHTDKGTADAKDNVVYMPFDSFDAYLASQAPAGKSGEWKHDTKGGLYNTHERRKASGRTHRAEARGAGPRAECFRGGRGADCIGGARGAETSESIGSVQFEF